MDIEEAKFILSALRSSRSERYSEIEINEALQLAEKNESLSSWLREQQQFDSVMIDRLQDFSVPADLKANILTGIKVTSKPKRRRRFIGALSAVAAIVIAGLFTWQLLEGQNDSKKTVSEYQRDMLILMDSIKGVDLKSSDPNQIVKYLEQEGAPLDKELAGFLDEYGLQGCKILDWQGNQVSLICFGAGRAGPPLHIMIIAADALEPVEPGQDLAMNFKEWSSTLWRSGNLVCLIAAKNADNAELRRMVPFG